jgi:predicted metal-dependent hydrolase
LVPEQRGVRVGEGCLAVGLPLGAGPDDIRVRIEFWMRDQARSLFAERIALYSQKLGRAPSRWSLSSARTRWGSCNPDGSIRLNWRLMHFSAEVIDYVIAHELTHLVEMNHGPRFWATLGTLYPDYERVRGLLRHHYDDTPAG